MYATEAPCDPEVVEKHIASILNKLALVLSSEDNLRTLAVLARLESGGH